MRPGYNASQKGGKYFGHRCCRRRAQARYNVLGSNEARAEVAGGSFFNTSKISVNVDEREK